MSQNLLSAAVVIGALRVKIAHRIMKKVMQRVCLSLNNSMSFEQSLELFNHSRILPDIQSSDSVDPSDGVVSPSGQRMHSSLPVEFS